MGTSQGLRPKRFTVPSDQKVITGIKFPEMLRIYTGQIRKQVGLEVGKGNIAVRGQVKAHRL